MTEIRKELIKCPQCKKKTKFYLWADINIGEHPEMKEKVVSGEAFMFTCPDCGAKVQVNFDITYEDPEQGLLIYCCPGKEEYKVRKQLLEVQSESRKDGVLTMGSDGQRTSDIEAQSESHKANVLGAQSESQSAGGAISNYILRLVPSQNQMREKVNIFALGLDDRVIEFVKAMVMAQLEEQQQGRLSYSEVLFLTMEDGKYAFELVNETQSLGLVPFEKELYDECAEKFGTGLKDIGEDDYIIDLAWVLQKVQADERAQQALN